MFASDGVAEAVQAKASPMAGPAAASPRRATQVEDTPKKNTRVERDEDDLDEDRPRRRSRTDDDTEDNRPRRRRDRDDKHRNDEEEADDDRPRRSRQDDEDDDRPRRRRDEDNDDDDDFPRRPGKKSRKKGKGLMIGLIAGGVGLLIALTVVLILVLGGGGGGTINSPLVGVWEADLPGGMGMKESLDFRANGDFIHTVPMFRFEKKWSPVNATQIEVETKNPFGDMKMEFGGMKIDVNQQMQNALKERWGYSINNDILTINAMGMPKQFRKR
jgi:hypothetical protein